MPSVQSDDCCFVTHLQLYGDFVESAGPTHLCVNKSSEVRSHGGKRAVVATEACNMHERAISRRRGKLQSAPSPVHHVSIGCFALWAAVKAMQTLPKGCCATRKVSGVSTATFCGTSVIIMRKLPAAVAVKSVEMNCSKEGSYWLLWRSDKKRYSKIE